MFSFLTERADPKEKAFHSCLDCAFFNASYCYCEFAGDIVLSRMPRVCTAWVLKNKAP